MENEKFNDQTEVIDRFNKDVPDREKRSFKLTGLTQKQKSILQGAAAGVGGIAFGAALMTIMGMNHDTDPNITPNPPKPGEDKPGTEELEVKIYSEAPFSDEVNDDMSFEKAFETAREDVGQGGYFEWHGKLYNCYTEEEWDSMDAGERAKFFDSIDFNANNNNITDPDEIIKILNDDTNDIEIIDVPDSEDIIITDNDDPFIDIDPEADDSLVINDDDSEDIEELTFNNEEEIDTFGTGHYNDDQNPEMNRYDDFDGDDNIQIIDEDFPI